MIVRKLSEIEGTEREVSDKNWTSPLCAPCLTVGRFFADRGRRGVGRMVLGGPDRRPRLWIAWWREIEGQNEAIGADRYRQSLKNCVGKGWLLVE